MMYLTHCHGRSCIPDNIVNCTYSYKCRDKSFIPCMTAFAFGIFVQHSDTDPDNMHKKMTLDIVFGTYIKTAGGDGALE